MVFHNVKAGVSWAGPWESLDNLIPLQRGRARRGKATCQESQRVSGRTKAKLPPASARAVPSPTPQLCYVTFTVTLPIFGVLFCLEVTIAFKESPQIILEMSTSMSKQALLCALFINRTCLLM